MAAVAEPDANGANPTEPATWNPSVASEVVTVHAAGSDWEEHDTGLVASPLDGRRLRVEVEGRGAAARPRIGELARAG